MILDQSQRFNVDKTSVTVDIKIILISLIIFVLSLTVVSAVDLTVHKSVVDGNSS